MTNPQCHIYYTKRVAIPVDTIKKIMKGENNRITSINEITLLYVIFIANSKIVVSCKNVFKNTDKEEITKIFTNKWADIIRLLEQIIKHT